MAPGLPQEPPRPPKVRFFSKLGSILGTLFVQKLDFVALGSVSVGHGLTAQWKAAANKTFSRLAYQVSEEYDPRNSKTGHGGGAGPQGNWIYIYIYVDISLYIPEAFYTPEVAIIVVFF